jgi:transposase-like protein
MSQQQLSRKRARRRNTSIGLENGNTDQLQLALPTRAAASVAALASEVYLPTGIAKDCRIVSVGKRRDGGTRYWCLQHRADATAKYGRRGKRCRYADQPPMRPQDVLQLDPQQYPGGVALWGAVPPVYDTTRQPLDRGIHVHARREPRGKKDIDWTYRGVRLITGSNGKANTSLAVSELDAIYFMVSSVFGYGTKYIQCTRCGHPHLDKDWFSVHAHRRHLCAGCGKTFPDTELGIGNPIAAIQATLGQRKQVKPARRRLLLKQADFQGGIQIWGSNPAIVWTASQHEEEGIHVHAFGREDDEKPELDETFSEVVIDGVALDPIMVRTLMAQSALPHIAGRVRGFTCPKCRQTHFSTGEAAFTPMVEYSCARCHHVFVSSGRLRKVIGNPCVDTLSALAAHAVRTPQMHTLGLLPETL